MNMKMIRIHLLEMKYEFLKALRMPAYSIPTVLFPLIFYVFFNFAFGSKPAPGAGVTMAAYMIATYGTFGVLGASMFGFGVSIAVERGQGWLEVKRTTPMPISAYFAAKMAMASVFSAIIVLGLFTLGFTIGGVHMPIATALAMFGILIGGALTFSSLGLAVGYFAGPNSAAAIANLIYLPMSVLSGLWLPIWALPKFIQKIALVLPAYHLSQLALGTIGGAQRGSVMGHVSAMAAATVVFLAVAYLGYRRDEGKMYG
jgi:ABC-2 type transport system permease protein